MFFKFFAIFLLFFLITPGLNLFKKNNRYYQILVSLLFTILFYFVMLFFKQYREGYTESYKITFNGVNDLVKMIEEMMKKEEEKKTVIINNDLTKQNR